MMMLPEDLGRLLEQGSPVNQIANMINLACTHRTDSGLQKKILTQLRPWREEHHHIESLPGVERSLLTTILQCSR